MFKLNILRIKHVSIYMLTTKIAKYRKQFKEMCYAPVNIHKKEQETIRRPEHCGSSYFRKENGIGTNVFVFSRLKKQTLVF